MPKLHAVEPAMTNTMPDTIVPVREANAYIIDLLDLFPDQHVHAHLPVVCEPVLRGCQDQTVALARDIAQLLAADPDFVPGDVDGMLDSLSIELVSPAIGAQRLV